MPVKSAVLGRLLASLLKIRPFSLLTHAKTLKKTAAMAEVRPNPPSLSECQDVPIEADSNVDTKEAKKGEEQKDGEQNPESKVEKLPKLSTHEFKIYNHMAEHMNYFHNNFKRSWTILYSACEANKRPSNLSIRQFLNVGLQFCNHLTLHHNIEEEHIFPVLAKRMPAFQHEMQMKTHHKAIHTGLVELQTWLEECRSGERELNLRELKAIMDTFRQILWEHLDAEVEQLGAENMRKFWTIAEMQKMPM
jgi:hemerythrin-like domain-containing protein